MGRLVDAEHQRAGALEEMQTLQASIEKATLAGESSKLVALHTTQRALRERLEELAGAQQVLSRHLNVLSEQERADTVLVHLAARRNAQHEGIAIADKLRSAVMVVQGLYERWQEWSETDRGLKDTLRSLAPDQMTASPDYGWATAVDQNFVAAVQQLVGEAQRAERELLKRRAASAAK